MRPDLGFRSSLHKDTHETVTHVSGWFRQRTEGRSCSCIIPGKTGISSLLGTMGLERAKSAQIRADVALPQVAMSFTASTKGRSKRGFMLCFCKAGTGSAGHEFT